MGSAERYTVDMQTIRSIHGRGRSIGYFEYHLPTQVACSQDEILRMVLKSVRRTAVGYAGFATKGRLRRYLAGRIFYRRGSNRRHLVMTDGRDIPRSEIAHIAARVLRRCHRFVSAPPTRLFIFPSFKHADRDDLGGIGGFTPWRNTILIFVALPLVPRWRKAFSDTIAHEFLHAVMLNRHRWETLGDSLVFEGLAEHFREQITDGKHSPWVGAISASEAARWLERLKPRLYSQSLSLYRRIFFGSRQYPKWAGYTIGYWFIKGFLRRSGLDDWNKIIRISPTRMLS